MEAVLQLFSGITLDVLVLAEVADGDVVEHSRDTADVGDTELTEETVDDLNSTYLISYKCDYCNFNSTKQEDIAGHMDSVHYNPCPMCEENFTWGNAMRKHIVDEHGNDEEHHHNDDLDDNDDWFNLTIDGVPCDGLVFEEIIDANDFTLNVHPEKKSSRKF